MNDSRQYRFAYLIRSRRDLPEDFPVFTESILFPALFLARDDPDWFGRSANPPRVILFTGETLQVHFHPEFGSAPKSFLCDDHLSVQTGRMLLIGWLGFASREGEITLPYNRRVDEPVHTFLAMLRARLLRAGAGSSGDGDWYGDALDIKFRNALHHEIDRGEIERARLFIAPRLQSTGHWPLRVARLSSGSLLSLTDRRLVWITERYRHSREMYGSVTCYSCLDGVERVETDGGAAACRLSVSLRNGKRWEVDIPNEFGAAAQAFAATCLQSAIPGNGSAIKT
jgi:hypothetical protein